MRGLAKIDFGDDGASEATVFVKVPGIDASAIPHAWLYPKATDDHTVEDHYIAPIKVVATQPTDDSGFTVYAWVESYPSPAGARVPYATGQYFIAWSL